jgi:SAM-dependent methyltransferase
LFYASEQPKQIIHSDLFSKRNRNDYCGRIMIGNCLIGQQVNELEVLLYDISVPDWPGEIDFYRSLAIEVKEHGGSVLEVGCGTGRVTHHLAKGGIPILGMDISPAMLSAARKKSRGRSNVRWVEGDMLLFNLGELFDLIIFPGHSFQFMLTPTDQVACLNCVRLHLSPGGKLVLHNNYDDLSWLGALVEGRETEFKLNGEYRPNTMKGSIRRWTKWSYEGCTQTASAVDAWEKIGENGIILERIESVPKRLHCIFPAEMEHLLARTGFRIEAKYGDFYQNELQDTSPDMIWVASL